MKNLILVIFESNNYFTKEMIKSSDSLKKRFSDIITLEEVQLNPDILREYRAIIDCTLNFKFYQNYLVNKIGFQIKDGLYEYLKTPKGNLIAKGKTITQLSFLNQNPTTEEINKQKNNMNNFNNMIIYIATKIPEYRNIINYEDGITHDGIIFTDLVKNSKKQYKVVKEIPENGEANTEYVTPNEIEIIHKLLEISKHIII